MSAGDEDLLALAHALRTPLTSLSLAVGLLDDGSLGPLSDAQRDLVAVMASEVGRLTLLVERALRTDRLGAYAGPIERTPVALAALVREAAAPIATQARDKGVTLTLRLAEDTAIVADPAKLGWVVSSMLGNALRFSPAGAPIEVDLARGGAEATITIRDRGPGIPREVAAGLFDRGSGRGLFLAKEIVEAHGGAIAFGEGEGGGAIFTIVLPLAELRGQGGPAEQAGERGAR
ncbi:MAG: HAMP domain-containing sensor histidine kinase [Byssovorax sp.]